IIAEYELPQIKATSLLNNLDKNYEVTKILYLKNVEGLREFNDPLLNNLRTTALIDNNKFQVSIGNFLQAIAEIYKANYG
ncbi:TolC family protein, partial [Francisella tularensis subsp. holarctica]|nr:TolC family protein [Francisella tularensis subsp. holarctica]